MLRASVMTEGNTVNMHAINTGEDARGIRGGDILVRFAEAIVGVDDDLLTRRRAELVDALGAEAMVDAAGVASNFERMVRIADSTGIALGTGLETYSAEVRADLDLERFNKRKS